MLPHLRNDRPLAGLGATDTGSELLKLAIGVSVGALFGYFVGVFREGERWIEATDGSRHKPDWSGRRIPGE